MQKAVADVRRVGIGRTALTRLTLADYDSSVPFVMALARCCCVSRGARNDSDSSKDGLLRFCISKQSICSRMAHFLLAQSLAHPPHLQTAQEKKRQTNMHTNINKTNNKYIYIYIDIWKIYIYIFIIDVNMWGPTLTSRGWTPYCVFAPSGSHAYLIYTSLSLSSLKASPRPPAPWPLACFFFCDSIFDCVCWSGC